MRSGCALLLLLFTVSCAGGSTTENKNNGFNSFNHNNHNNTNNFNNVPGDFGKVCSFVYECQSEFCVPFTGPTDKRCTITCTKQDCPNNFHCRPASREAGAPNICLPISPLSCMACEQDNQCGMFSDRCVDTGEMDACLMDCSVEAKCLPGYTCTTADTTAGFSSWFCFPTTGSCDCSASSTGITQPCSTVNQHGSCDGIRTCMGDAGWSECDAQVPAPEVCDGTDNNCNGQIDEGLLGVTLEHCTACNTPCTGTGMEGTNVQCVQSVCQMSCSTGYFDPDQQAANGCECRDDHGASAPGSSTGNARHLGNFSDCDFEYPAGTFRVPVDANNRGPNDYFKYNYDNTWGCIAYNYVRISIPSGSSPMRLCGGPGTTESAWNCITVSPGQTRDLEMLPLPSNGNSTVMYFKVENMTNEYLPNCGEYQILVYDN